MLVAAHLGCSRMELYTQFDRPLEEEIVLPLRELLKRRGEREPLQYLLGSVQFHGREFRCDARALIPRPDTEELCELILARESNVPGLRVADIGCGSGIIGLTLAAERPAWQVTLADVSPDALALTAENAAALGLNGAVNLIASDLLANVAGPLDLLVANLPYIATTEAESLAPELACEPELALFSGSDGLDLLRRLIASAGSVLAPGARIYLEIGHSQAPAVTDLLAEAGFCEIRVDSDLAKVPRFPSATWPENA